MTDDRIREYVFPVKIKATGGEVSGENYLLDEKILQIAVAENELVKISGKGYVILDFGKEMYGGVRILTKRTYNKGKENSPVTARLRFGESLTETCAELGYKNATNDHAVRDMTVTLGSHSDMEFGNTGFRFLRFDLLSDDAAVLLKSIVAVYVHRDLKPAGRFNCDDERLNEIYSVAARTCTLCMQSMLWDGIKRDKLVWMGDMHPEMMTIQCLFGYNKCIDDALAFVVNQFRLPEYVNLKPSYSLWFVVVLYDWYMQNGDVNLLKKHVGYVEDLFDNLDALVDENGDMHLKGYFFDWPTHPNSDSNSGGSDDSRNGVKALFLIALADAREIFRVLGKDGARLSRLESRLLKGVLPAPVKKQAVAFKALCEKDFSERVCAALTDGGCKGFSTFMAYYLLDAIANCGAKEKAVEIMKEYYGAMLDKGATTFWEDFDIQWVKGTGRIDEFPNDGEEDVHGDRGDYCYKGFRHSLCHGWSSAPVPFLTKYVLGVNVLSPGCREIAVKPYLPDGVNRVNGSYPTPFGTVEIKHERVNGKIISEISAPEQVKIIRG